jgi:DNA-binding NarL/FixJ family response regulator/RecA/RadA recombinase
VRCPILIGRQEPAALIAGALRRLAGPRRGSALVVAGEAGIGKSRLADHMSVAAARADVQVVTGRAMPAGIGGPLGPVAEVIHETIRGRPAPADTDLAPYLAVLASLVPHWRQAEWSAPAEPVLVTAEAVLRLLRWAAGGRGMVLVMEDLHWADDATLAVTRYLVSHADDVPVALLATVRTGEGRDDVTAVLGSAGAQVCHLGRLTSDEARDMAVACTGHDSLPASQVAAVVQASEGLPLLVEDLLATGDLSGIPPRFADTVRARLARLDAGQLRVLAAAALLGRRFDWRLLEHAAAVPDEVVAAALHRGATLQLVVSDGDGFAFRHALTREVILADLAGRDRQRLALSAAEALTLTDRASGLDVSRALLTGRLLADGGRPAQAAAELLAAGDGAFAAGDFASAELLLREADQMSGLVPDDLRITVAARLAQVLLQAGQPVAAGQVAERTVAAADGRDPATAAAMRLVLARVAAMTARWDDARAQIAELRRGDIADPASVAETALIQAQIALGDGRAGTRAGAERLAAEAVGLATEAGRPELACEALETLGSCARLHDLDAAAAALRRALDSAAAARLPVHRLRILSELGTVEMLRDARGERLEQARAEAIRAGAVGLAVGIGANRAALLAMTARFADVMDVAGEVERSARRLGLVPLQAAARLMQGFALAHQGRAQEMERHLSAAEALAPGDQDLRAGAWGIGRALCALLAEDRDGARQALDRARHEAPDQHARILNPYEGPELLLRAVAGQAGRGETDTAAASIVKAARWPELWFRAAQAVARGTDDDAAGAETALAAALDAGSPYPVFSALVRRLVAEAAIRDRWGTPQLLLRSADATFTGLRLGRASTACRMLLKAAGHPAPRRRAADAGLPAALVASGVTAREAEVLDLLGDRLSNREIAEQLFLSPRTVEKHVAALLTKLDAQSRADLARLARAQR